MLSLSRRLDNQPESGGGDVSGITADVAAINATLTSATSSATPDTLMKRDATNKAAVGTLETDTIISSGTLAVGDALTVSEAATLNLIRLLPSANSISFEPGDIVGDCSISTLGGKLTLGAAECSNRTDGWSSD